MRPVKFFFCVVAHIEGGLDAATEEEAASEQQNSVCLSGGLMRRAAPAPVSFHSQSTASVSETPSDDIFFKAVGRLGIFCCFLSVVIFSEEEKQPQLLCAESRRTATTEERSLPHPLRKQVIFFTASIPFFNGTINLTFIAF